MAFKNYRQLDVWNKAILLANKIYDATSQFPKNEVYALANQMQGAAVSIASNIAEGSIRGSKADYRRFCEIAHGSLAELETQIILAYQRNYMAENIYQEMLNLAEDISRMLYRLRNSLTEKDS